MRTQKVAQYQKKTSKAILSITLQRCTKWRPQQFIKQDQKNSFLNCFLKFQQLSVEIAVETYTTEKTLI